MWQLPVGALIQGVSGFLGAKSQQGATKRAGSLLAERGYDKAREALARAEEINPRLAEQYSRAQQLIEGTAFPEADRVQQRGERAGEEAVAAAREAGGYLDPYRTAGSEALTSLSEMGKAKAPTAADLEMDPGYQFRLAEGMKALQRSAAAKGGLLSGGTLRGITRYSQSEASQEYQNAFERFMKQQEARRLSLSQLANMGYGASGKAGEFLTQGTEFAGRAGMQGTEFGANMRVGAAQRVGGLGIESAQQQAQNLIYADQVARGAWDEAAQAHANSIVGTAQANPWAGALSAVGQGLTGWGLNQMAQDYYDPYGSSRTPTSRAPRGGRRVPEYAIGGG